MPPEPFDPDMEEDMEDDTDDLDADLSWGAD
jgi:hypothetical protein